jgi:hypothetical protein
MLPKLGENESIFPVILAIFQAVIVDKFLKVFKISYLKLFILSLGISNIDFAKFQIKPNQVRFLVGSHMLLPLFMKNPADNKSYFTREDIFEQLSKLSAVPQPSSKYTIIFNPSDRQYFTNGRNTFEIPAVDNPNGRHLNIKCLIPLGKCHAKPKYC